MKISVLYCLPIAKFHIFLECLLTYTHPVVYPKCIGSGIQTTVKSNKLSNVMTVCRRGFHNDVMTHMLQFGGGTIHIIFVR